MEKMGLTVTGETEELLKVAEAKSATAKGNILNWIQEQGFDPKNPDEKVVEALLEDARSYQSAIDRTRKTRPVADIELGKDLFLTCVRDPDGNLIELIGPRATP
jgi:hypothetical protein